MKKSLILILFFVFNLYLSNSKDSLKQLDRLVRLYSNYGLVNKSDSINEKLTLLAKKYNIDYYIKKSSINTLRNLSLKGVDKRNIQNLNILDNKTIKNKDLLYYYYDANARIYNYNYKIESDLIQKAIDYSENSSDEIVKYTREFRKLYLNFYTKLYSNDSSIAKVKQLTLEKESILSNLKKEYNNLPLDLKFEYYMFFIYDTPIKENKKKFRSILTKLQKLVEGTEHINGKILINVYESIYYGYSEKSNQFLKKADSLSQYVQDTRYKYLPSYNLAHVYTHPKYNDPQKALYWARRARYPLYTNTNPFYKTYLFIAKIHEKENNLDSAIYYYKIHYEKFHEHNEEVLINYLQDDLLKKINVQEKEIITRQNMFLILTTLLISVVPFIILYIYTQQKSKKKLLSTNKALQNSNEKLSLYTDIISHDLKVPFVSILSILQLVTEEKNDLLDKHPKLKEKINAVSEISTSSINKIKNILSYYKYKGQGANDVSNEKVNLFDIIEELDTLFSKNRKQKDYILKNKLSLNLNIMGSSSLLREVFQNLIDNAIKNPKPNTPCKIVIYEEPNKNNNITTIVVKDYGVGIKKEFIDKIFMKGFGENASNLSFGYGLYYCKQMVEEFKYGKIWCDSVEGEYTEMYVRLNKS